MSQHPQAHDEDGMVENPTAAQEVNAQELLEYMRLLYARLANLDALLNSEVILAPDSGLFEDFDSFAAAPLATPQETHDEDIVIDEEDPNMVHWQDAEVQVLLRSLREENALVNAVYDTEEAVWSDSDSDENVVHFTAASAATANRVISDPDTAMIDVLLTPAFVMPPLLLPPLPDIVEKELLRSEVLSTPAPLESDFVRLQISNEQEDEERRRKNTCPECGLLCDGKVKLGDHGVEEHGWVVISIEDCQDDC